MAQIGSHLCRLINQQAPLSGLFIVLAFSDFYDNEGKTMTTKTKGRNKGQGTTKKK